MGCCKMYVTIDEDGRICSSTPYKEYTDERYFEFEFSEQFDFSKQFEYRIVDSELIHDPLPPSEEEIIEKQTQERKNTTRNSCLYIRSNERKNTFERRSA